MQLQTPLLYFMLVFFILIILTGLYIILDIKGYFKIEQKMYTEMYKDKFGRIHNKGRIKIKNYIFKGLFLQIIILDVEKIYKYYYLKINNPGKYFKIFKTSKKYV